MEMKINSAAATSSMKHRHGRFSLRPLKERKYSICRKSTGDNRNRYRYDIFIEPCFVARSAY
jgi:hypothetical protein